MTIHTPKVKVQPQYDIIVYGATGFVGKIICSYLSESAYTGTWAIAGRSESKLKALKRELGLPHLDYFLADSEDTEALTAFCKNTKVVLTTVGPYARYGDKLVAVCAGLGTDYVDLTGEATWYQRMLHRHQGQAEQSGARLVPCGGFDSVPSDVGVWYLQHESQKAHQTRCAQVTMRVKSMKGQASGGTIASGMVMADEVRDNPAILDVLKNPYALCPRDRGLPQQVILKPRREKTGWVTPFIMASINEKVVQRSHQLLGGTGSLLYNEAVMVSPKKSFPALRAWSMAGALGMGMAVIGSPKGRKLLKPFIPQPGEGPTPEQQRSGFYEFIITGYTGKGDKVRVKVKGDRDPGYGSTAKIIAETAILLAETKQEGTKGGFWTPALFAEADERYVKRLARAGLKFELMPTMDLF